MDTKRVNPQPNLQSLHVRTEECRRLAKAFIGDVKIVSSPPPVDPIDQVFYVPTPRELPEPDTRVLTVRQVKARPVNTDPSKHFELSFDSIFGNL